MNLNLIWRGMKWQKEFSSLVLIFILILKSATFVSTNPNRLFNIKHIDTSFMIPPLDSLDGDQQGEINDSLCTLSTIPKLSNQDDQTIDKIVFERVLNCSKVNENNYRKMMENLYNRNKLSIHQIHLTDTDPLVVFSAIDLICDHYDCSKLTTFNITGQKVHDSNVLKGRLNQWPELEILDLSNTSLISLESIFQNNFSTVLQNLTSLNLDFNQITLLDFDLIFERMPNLKYLSLVNNTIYNVTCEEKSKPKVRTQFEQINLAGNAINCNRSQLWLMKQFQATSANLKFPDYDKISCSTPEGLSDMTWPQRISVLETKICDKCDCRSLKRAAISVDCHNKSLIALPDVLPLNTKVLNLTSNRINSLGLPQNSKNWENVTYVHLENNLITSFQQLDKNSKFMRNLAALDIRKNRFQEFPSHIFEQFINLDQVHLSNNPWLCDCESTFAFQEWLQRQFHKVGDKEEILCGIAGSDENGVRSINLQQRLSARVIYRLSKSELCPQNNQEEPYDWLDFVNIALFISILLILSKVTIDYIYQHRTKRLPHFFKLNY